MIGTVLSGAQLALAGSALMCGAWWSVLSFAALKRPAPGPRNDRLRWAVLVPAHNEEERVGDTVRSVLAAGADPSSVLVIADNCSDWTAMVARAAGARVLERTDPTRRGKSFALEAGLAHLRAQSVAPEAVAFIDADSTVNAGFFAVVASYLVDGSPVVQAHYAGGPGDSDIVRLRRLALSLVHWARPLGARRLGLPTTLKGNGMAFRWEVIRGGFPGAGITEDASATLELARRGIVTSFAPEAVVTGLMAGRYGDAATQDLRWEGGRLSIAPRAFRLALHLASRRQLRASAACLELASPPLTFALGMAGLALALGIGGFGSLPLAVAGCTSLVTYVLAGLLAARPAASDVAALVHAPRFVLYKFGVFLRLLRGQPRSWTRTVR